MALTPDEVVAVTESVTTRLQADDNLGESMATTLERTGCRARRRAMRRIRTRGARLLSVREAAVPLRRMVCWTHGLALRSLTIASADGTSLTKEFNTSMHAAGFRHSGAMAELTRYVRRRAGAIG